MPHVPRGSAARLRGVLAKSLLVRAVLCLFFNFIHEKKEKKGQFLLISYNHYSRRQASLLLLLSSMRLAAAARAARTAWASPMRGSQARRWGLVADAAPEACVLGRSWTTSTHEPNRSVPLAFPSPQPRRGLFRFSARGARAFLAE
jgi:hypothetical protein